jgi:hypothetical protein
MKRVTVIGLVAAMLLGLSVAVYAQEKTPDATLTLTEGQVAVGIGWSWGKGVLTYKGKQYPFKIKGLSMGDVGVTKVSASGKVYYMRKLEDFNGTYSGVAAQGTLAGGMGATRVNNENDVMIDLVSTTQGVSIKLAFEGATFTLIKK